MRPNHTLVSVDPGKRHAGVALFDDKELVAAWLSKAKKPSDPLLWPIATTDQVIADLRSHIPPILMPMLCVERPVVRDRRQSKGAKADNDLIDVAMMAAAIARGSFKAVKFYLPEHWKGQVEKNAMVRRIQKRLDPSEIQNVMLPTDKKRQLDVWDAVGIGLKYLGRL